MGHGPDSESQFLTKVRNFIQSSCDIGCIGKKENCQWEATRVNNKITGFHKKLDLNTNQPIPAEEHYHFAFRLLHKKRVMQLVRMFGEDYHIENAKCSIEINMRYAEKSGRLFALLPTLANPMNQRMTNNQRIEQL